jgi:HD-like signal output (HDOD) protein
LETDRAVIERIAGLVDDLPALPVVAQQVLALLSEPTTEPEELQTVLSRDPSLSLKVLRLANSAYYRRSREVTTLSAAVVMLGFKTIQSLVLSSAVHRVLSAAGAASQSLWIHCFGVAVACRELTRRASSRVADPEEAFLTGLFHDVGKGVIAAKFPGVYDRPLGIGGELEALGFHHGHLGRVLLDRWEIPAPLAVAVGIHHDPETDALGTMASVGDWVAWGLAPGLGADPPEAPEQTLQDLELGPDQLAEAREALTVCLSEEGVQP